jgi:hypothetical protein
MKDWEERCPFLEEDVHASIREHARRRSRGLRSGELSYRGRVALDVQERFSVETREGFPALLNSALECI